MDNSTEKLIENVKKHNILFDPSHPHHKNVRIKNKVWAEIADCMKLRNTDGNQLKKRWKNLKDCYAKYLRAEQNDKSVVRYKAWPWAQHMEPFRPFSQFTQTEELIASGIAESLEATHEEIEFSEQNETEETLENLRGKPSNIKEDERPPIRILHTRKVGEKQQFLEDNPRQSQSSSIDNIINVLDKKHANIEYDEIDLIFQGYAASVKKLSPRRQILIKFKIAKLIMEEELAQQAEI